MRPPAVLITGASGFLGGYCARELQRRGAAVITAGRRGADVLLDLADPAAAARAVAAAAPDVVLSCGALATVAACERDPALARAVNTEAVAALSRVAPRLVQVSTDLVFDGERAPYSAGAAPAPRSVYGATKAEAELAVLRAGGAVARVPLLFGPSGDGRRGATDMIRSAADEVALFDNELRTPLHAADAARGLVDLVLDASCRGVVHLAGPERLSRFELGMRFARIAGLDASRLRRAACSDPTRPRDVSLVGPWSCGRSLDAALAEC